MIGKLSGISFDAFVAILHIHESSLAIDSKLAYNSDTHTQAHTETHTEAQAKLLFVTLITLNKRLGLAMEIVDKLCS